MSTSRKSVADERSGYHHGNLREALLEHGLALLEEKGESQFSLRELARRVGVTANAVYRHFSSKDVLLMGLAAEGMRQFTASQASAWGVTRGNVAEKFLASGCAYVRFARNNPALFRLMFGRFIVEHRSEELEHESRQAFAGLTTAVAATLGVPEDSGDISGAVNAAWAVVHGFSHLILDGQIHGSDEELDATVASALGHWLVSN
ncbi:MAG: TetR/AcrR family transcriptional regulator [Gammaproteobacteria bacterium]|jgi:AcrR family transcriptional regulator|nr:TetR/AcrR family transcriptional regulator [Gammaproteobacteria bacterium]MBQ0775436.1 TetR/AcrR family transcriptional regulator [Gammaproteobacteria bacterium]|tara:strand:- start:74810 stop:75424 length:615 start_codon:yes stop_codon:yes gene_type:complete